MEHLLIGLVISLLVWAALQVVPGRTRPTQRGWRQSGFRERVDRPTGQAWVSLTREGVVSSYTLAPGILIWAATRIQWQFSRDKRWEVRVDARHVNRGWRTNLHSQYAPSKKEAAIIAQDVFESVCAGDFDYQIQYAGQQPPVQRRTDLPDETAP